MWQRELSRAEKGLMSAVPKLRERHIQRDSWTRLNVAPAKIMQVCIYYNMSKLDVCVHVQNVHLLCCIPLFSKTIIDEGMECQLAKRIKQL